MTATEIELRAEVLTLQYRIAQLEKQLKDDRGVAEHVRHAFVAALDQPDVSQDTRHRIMISAAAELMLTVAAMGDDDQPGPHSADLHTSVSTNGDERR